MTPLASFVTATIVVSRAPSPSPGLTAEATPAAVAFAIAMFSAQGPPVKWYKLMPVKTRPSEQSAAEPTVLEEVMGVSSPLYLCTYEGYFKLREM